MTIISAFPTAGGIQVNRQIDANTLSSLMVFPGDDGWDEALAAAGHYEAQPEAGPITLDDLREAAALPRSAFLLGCVRVGLLTQSDALQAAKGEIPSSFSPYVASLSPEEQFEIELRWAALTQVERMHPLILALAEQIPITPEQLDLIFGITAP